MAALAIACVANAASAQNEEAASAAQFDRGLAAMKAGRYSVACPALAESQRLDPRLGTLFTLASCEAAWGKVASAMAHFDDYLSAYDRLPSDQKVRQRGRNVVAAQQMKALKHKVPTVVFTMPSDAPRGTTVKCDGTTLGAPSLGIALPMDPGKHTVVVTNDDGELTSELEVAMGDKKTFALTLPPHKEKPAPEGPTVAAPLAPNPTPPPSGGGRGWAWALVAIGGAGIVGGAVTGGIVFGEKPTIDQNCPSLQCNDTGLSALSTARTLGIVSDVAFAVGGVSLLVGFIVLVTAPSHPRATTGLVARPGGLGWSW
jgi:hypothetical protein